MKRTRTLCSISLIVGALLLGFLSGCGKKSTQGPAIIVEQIKPMNEALLPLLDSYTSGVITEGEPIVVRFKDPQVLKVHQGETLPSKLFSFTPELKGKAVWMDENTVAFQYDKIDNSKQYVCHFKVSDLLDMAATEPLEFGFGVRRQTFSLAAVEPVCEGGDVMAYNLGVVFATPIENEDAVKIFDESVIKQYQIQTTYYGNNMFEFKLQSIPRKDADYQLAVVMDGKNVGAETQIRRSLTIYAKDKFIPASFEVENASGRGVLFFTQPLKQGQNLNGFITFDQKKLAYKSDIKDNRVDFYFDKSTLYRYQLEDITMTVGAGIKSASNAVLQESQEFQFSLTDYEPQVRWTDEGVILPDIKETTVYFDAVCLNGVTLRIIRIFDDNILSFLQDNELNETYGIRKVGRLEKKVRLQLDNPYPTQWKTFPIVLSEYIKVEPGAMYQLSLDFGPADYVFASEEMKMDVKDNAQREADYWDGEAYDYKEYRYDGEWGDPNGYYYYNYVEKTKNIVVSDLAVTAKMGRNDIVDAYVYQISDANPASGAEVTAYNFQKQQIAKGSADGKGHVQLQCANRPAFIVAQDRKGSKSVIKLNDGNALSYSRFNVDGESVEKGVIGFAYSNRGVWRPGDELQLNLMLSDADAQLPENYPVVLEVTDAAGRLYTKQVNTKPMNGLYCFNVQTNPSDETGLWMARYKVGTTTIAQYLRV